MLTKIRDSSKSVTYLQKLEYPKKEEEEEEERKEERKREDVHFTALNKKKRVLKKQVKPFL